MRPPGPPPPPPREPPEPRLPDPWPVRPPSKAWGRAKAAARWLWRRGLLRVVLQYALAVLAAVEMLRGELQEATLSVSCLTLLTVTDPHRRAGLTVRRRR